MSIQTTTILQNVELKMTDILINNAYGSDDVAKASIPFIEKGGLVWVCKACADAKGMTDDDLIDGAIIAGAGNILDLVENGGQVLM